MTCLRSHSESVAERGVESRSHGAQSTAFKTNHSAAKKWSGRNVIVNGHQPLGNAKAEQPALTPHVVRLV